MRRLLVYLIVAIAFGGVLGTLLARDPGYVLIAYDDWSFESSLWFVVSALVLLYIVLRGVGYLLARVKSGGHGMRSFRERRRVSGARTQAVKGQVLLAEGRFAEAKKVLTAAASRAETPFAAHLAAARAADGLGETEERDALLRRAEAAAADVTGAKVAVGLTRAELDIARGHFEPALATLLELSRTAGRHPRVLEGLAECYAALGDHQALAELIGELRRAKALDETRIRAYEREAWIRRLAAGGAGEDAAARLTALWKEVPKELKQDGEVVSAYAATLLGRGEAAEAEAVLRAALARSWDDRLVALYGRITGADPARQLVVAEGWLKERPNNSVLLLALGRISMMNHEWARAREYLEASLRLNRSGELYAELGRLCVALGDTVRGGEYLARSFAAGGHELPDVPLPVQRDLTEREVTQRGA